MEINAALRSYQVERSEVLALLHKYLPLIVKRFYGGDLPLPALSWERDCYSTLGSYRKQDGLSLSHRINLNRVHAAQPLAAHLMVITHELGHEWQHLYGKPGKPPYHNTAFRAKMLEIGIPCTDRGLALPMQEPFVSFLQELGVEAEAFSFKQEFENVPARPGSRLKPWSCGCTRVWASNGVTVTATCTKKGCGNPFQRQ